MKQDVGLSIHTYFFHPSYKQCSLTIDDTRNENYTDAIILNRMKISEIIYLRLDILTVRGLIG